MTRSFPLIFFLGAASVLRLSLAAAPLPTSTSSITLGLNLTHTLSFPQKLKKVSVGNSKIIRVREVSPNKVLITAVGAGTTSLKLWDERDIETAYDVTVLTPELAEQTREDAEERTVKVSLEFIELDSARSRTEGVRFPDIIQGAGSGTVGGDLSNSGINYVFSFSSARGWIEMMQKQGWARILANPDLYVRLGEVATFHSGGEFPVPTTSENYGRYMRHVEWKSFGLTVRVRPQSPDNYRIGSEIHIDISEVDRSISSEGVPALIKRKLDTKINSVDGETVILSGLVRQASGYEKDGVPFLSDIPLLGVFFSKTHSRWERSELLMAITFSVRSKALDDQRRADFHQKFENPEAKEQKK